MIAIDASSLAKCLLREQGWSEIEAYLERGVVSVNHVAKEVSNAIWRHAIVRRVISREKAIAVFKSLLKLVEERVFDARGREALFSKGLRDLARHRSYALCSSSSRSRRALD